VYFVTDLLYEKRRGFIMAEIQEEAFIGFLTEFINESDRAAVGAV